MWHIPGEWKTLRPSSWGITGVARESDVPSFSLGGRSDPKIISARWQEGGKLLLNDVRASVNKLRTDFCAYRGALIILPVFLFLFLSLFHVFSSLLSGPRSCSIW